MKIKRKNPDPGDKKSSGYPEGKKFRIPRIKIPGISHKIPKLGKIPIPGD